MKLHNMNWHYVKNLILFFPKAQLSKIKSKCCKRFNAYYPEKNYKMPCTCAPQ